MKMSTEEILNALKDQKVTEFPTELFEGNKINIVHYLNQLVNDHETTVAALLPDLCYERSYVYQMFNGTRKPTRTFLLRLSILLHLSFNEAQQLLLVAEKPMLYPKIRFDAVIIYALEHDLTPAGIEEILYELKEPSLFERIS
ncbi:MAG: hypothetical protein IJ733_06805 [Lachnospiraceae bacterium]|nr:hypothetical protein [Lachnospiraceae bacterium]